MQALNPISFLGNKQQTLVPKLILASAVLCVSATLLWRPPRRRKTPYELSPAKTLSSKHSKARGESKGVDNDIEDLPYPPDTLPGARDVETPYGSIRVYEWGPQDGERVLFVHGISTPVVALGDLGHEMVARGYRVMMFDLFGRGYSDAPNDLAYDTRLFVTQLLLVLASSSIRWTPPTGFHLVGYSLGGGLSVAFTRYFPHLVRSLTLIAPCGLIRRRHVGWRSWLYYNSGLLPEVLVKRLVRRRIRPAARKPADLVAAESSERVAPVNGDGDANGGAGFDSAAISRTRPHVTVASVVAWQVDHHEGFVMAFLSTIRNAPIYAPQEDWRALSRILQSRRHSGLRGPSGDAEVAAGLEGGKIFVVLGKDDGVIVMDEMIEDAHAVLGREGVEVVVLEGGHELPITSSGSVAESIEGFWKSG
ncbi:alpha/beta-hydrolase [Xylaria sp. FL0933]|nr:alpha/beta-hydrolase [Xylaria sp. FL0933]